MADFERFRPKGNEFQQIVGMHDALIGLYRNLQTVKQEEMLTNSMHVLSKFISLMPRSIQKDFSKLRNTTNVANRTARGLPDPNSGMDDMSAKDLFELLVEFLKDERKEAVT